MANYIPMNHNAYVHHEPAPTKEEAEARAYMDYVKHGDPFFVAGLTFDEYHAQKARMIGEMQSNAKTEANFYNMRETEFDGYKDK